MPVITLPDGSQRVYGQPLTGAEVAADIGAGLAKAAVAMAVNGKQQDLSETIHTDSDLRIFTVKDEDGLDVMRHTLAAQILTRAVQELFPDAKLAIGPTIEHGFYHDFDFPEPIRPEDLERIEARMREIIKEDQLVIRTLYPRQAAIDFFKQKGELYKVEIIEGAPADQTEISLYHQGSRENPLFTDLCIGPHLPSTGKAIGGFKLLNLAGAYWRGDSKNKQLTRIYGTAWANEKELKEHLHRIEEAVRRDHRKLGVQHDLFHFEDYAPGAVFWHPKGWTLFLQLVDYMRKRQKEAGYVEVNTPDVMDRSLWELSGHWQNYRQNMFTTQTEDERIFALKPMNCPGSMAMFKHGLKSYRDLPLRMAEFGKVHRYEPSGALHGLLRVRHFTQDDAHIFCTEAQMEQECRDVIKLIMDIYHDFGFADIKVKLSTRPENRIGSDESWDRLEGALAQALDQMKMPYTLFPGEGAFYGPKLEFVLRDTIGRDWQCGTLQADMSLPGPDRFDLTYIAEDGSKQRPTMLHRALFGSLERFIGILIEHYVAAFPIWLAPVQAVITGITDKHAEYVLEIEKILSQNEFRVETDLRNEKIGFKIREATLARTPYILVAGDREVEQGLVAVRTRSGEDLGDMTLEDFMQRMRSEIAQRGRDSIA